MSHVRCMGLDVHAETIAVAVAEPDGEVRSVGVIPNRPASIRTLVKTLGPPAQLRVCDEAGPTGSVVDWQLTALDVACQVVAPTLVPVKPGDRVKTDRRDALKLARRDRAGDVTPVWVPDAAHEARRDRVRAREAAKKDPWRARHRLGKCLLRHGRRPPTAIKAWTQAPLAWVKRAVHVDHAAQALMLLSSNVGYRPKGEQLMGHDGRFRQVNRYSAVHGFAAGFPNFHEADHGEGVYGTLLLRTGAVEWRDVPRANYGNANIDDVPALFRAANDYAADNGFDAGFPTCEQGMANGSVVYGTNLVRSGLTEFRDVLRVDLGSPNLSDVPAMMRAANDYAAAKGFPAAFPTFHQANYGAGVVYGIVLFKPGTVVWRDVPANFLARYTRPTKWAVVLCYPSDGAEGNEQTKAKRKLSMTLRHQGRRN